MVINNKPISLAEDAKLLSALIALLNTEQSNLIKADADAIQAVLDKKSMLLQQLNQAAKVRYDALSANGYTANEAGMEAWVQSQSNASLKQSWAKLQQMLAQAKELNRLNGVLITKHFNRNQELLNHLQGKAGSDSVYGRDGQAKSSTLNRPGLVV